MNLALWIVTILLAVVLFISSAKLVLPKSKMLSIAGTVGAWIEDFSPRQIKALGVADLLGAIGLILPAVVGIAEFMVPVTAVCVAALFTGAIIVRVRRGQPKTAIGDAVYLIIAVFIAVGRFGPWAF